MGVNGPCSHDGLHGAPAARSHLVCVQDREDDEVFGLPATERRSEGGRLCSTFGHGERSALPGRTMDKVLPSPDELNEPLSGGFAHVLIVDGQNLVSWQQFVLRGATCRERGSALVWPRVLLPARRGEGNHLRSVYPRTWAWRDSMDSPEGTGTWGGGTPSTPYLLPPIAPPRASHCRPQSRIRSGDGAGPSPVGACPKAAAHIPYHRHTPPASHGCRAQGGKQDVTHICCKSCCPSEPRAPHHPEDPANGSSAGGTLKVHHLTLSHPSISSQQLFLSLISDAPTQTLATFRPGGI